MDKPNIPVTQNSVPAQLWVGNHAILVEETTKYLQEIFCVHSACGSCSTCLHISQQQHHAATWLAPEKTYTLELLEPLFATIAYELEKNAQHFFIIQHADYLSTLCANKLLKSIEEPPQGYHFILLTEHKEQVIDTIRSRSIIKEYNSQQGIIAHEELFSYFATIQKQSPIAFTRTLDQSKITEHETINVLDALNTHWTGQYKQNIDADNRDTIGKIHALLITSYNHLPMPGGSKFFWRNLFLKIQNYL